MTGELRVTDLRSQVPRGLVATGERPRLSWKLSGGASAVEQRAYEVQTARSSVFEEVISSSGTVESSNQIGVPAPGAALESREIRHYRVRVTTNKGATPWSDGLTVEAGLLHPADWLGKAISLPEDPGSSRASAAPILRKEFSLDATPLRARLHVTSLGLNHVLLNGAPVTDALLAPGWTAYRQRLLVDTHDVTSQLHVGPNAIGVTLGDGWYRGRLGFTPGDGRGRYGRQLALLLQLEIELKDGGRVVVCSDDSWRASTGEIQAADLYDGSTIDLRASQLGWDRPGFDDAAWVPVASVNVDVATLAPRTAPQVRAIDVRPVHFAESDGLVRIDTEQNLAGFLRLRAQGRAGDRIVVRHAEVLESSGALHTRALRSARATDEFILRDAQETTLEPAFTFHGFRFAEIESDAQIIGADVVAISTDLPQRSRFACSDERLNQLHDNVLWSLRGNFVSLPTDCPQRDERLGWTGDAQAFAATACTLVDSHAFWRSWLRDLELDQDDEHGVPSVVPDVVLEGEARFGRAGWADAATIVPWAVYESYGDPEVLRRQFPSMRRWVESLMRRRGSDGLLVPSFQFGDWLDPDAPSDRPWEAKCDSDYIANSYFSWSARLTADAADVIGEQTASAVYRDLADRVAALTWARWAWDALRSQTGCAVALQLQIAPSAERTAVGDMLSELVDAADGRVATGFLGTPLVLPALSGSGKFDSAYRMLLRSEVPSWLYQLTKGATTVWERWDAIRPDGSIHPGTMASPTGDGEEGHMLSFNHYAYGAVIDWVYRHVAGLAPDRTQPGYAHVLLEPRPDRRITWARAGIDAPYGPVSIDWRIEDSRMLVDVVLPPGTSGSFRAPTSNSSALTVDGRPVAAGVVRLQAGAHKVVVENPAVANDGH